MVKRILIIKTSAVDAAKEAEKKSLARKHNRRLKKLQDELTSLRELSKEKRPIYVIAAAVLSELEKSAWDETKALLRRVSG